MITIFPSDLIRLLADSLRSQAWKLVHAADTSTAGIAKIVDDVVANQAQSIAMSDTTSTGYWAGKEETT